MNHGSHSSCFFFPQHLSPLMICDSLSPHPTPFMTLAMLGKEGETKQAKERRRDLRQKQVRKYYNLSHVVPSGCVGLSFMCQPQLSCSFFIQFFSEMFVSIFYLTACSLYISLMYCYCANAFG